ncbi:MAG: VanZ family protein [Luteolibacter sp.]
MVRWLKSNRQPLATIAAAGFIGFFIWIIVIADKGEGVRWWSFIDSIPGGDKAGHFALVGILSFLCNLAFTRWTVRRVWSVTPVTWGLFVLIALEEFSQGFIPHRHLEFLDLLADLAGLAAGQMLAMRCQAGALPGLRVCRLAREKIDKAKKPSH